MVQEWGAVNPKYIHFEMCSINISLSTAKSNKGCVAGGNVCV